MTDYEAILPRGKENARSSASLAEELGFKSNRALQQDIAKARKDGQIICSASTGGYYLPADRDELKEFIKTLEHRAANTFGALKSAKAVLKSIDGQLTIEDIKDDPEEAEEAEEPIREKKPP